MVAGAPVEAERRTFVRSRFPKTFVELQLEHLAGRRADQDVGGHRVDSVLVLVNGERLAALLRPHCAPGGVALCVDDTAVNRALASPAAPDRSSVTTSWMHGLGDERPGGHHVGEYRRQMPGKQLGAS